MEPSDTIAAIATPPGSGALSLIRISGPDAIEVASRASLLAIREQRPRTVRYGKVWDDQGQIIDDGLFTVFHKPASATGEYCVEFTGHGGILVSRLVLERFLSCGARLAEPGEFSQRAYLHGKLDLTQAEAVMDLISAQTQLSLRAARSQMEGRLGRNTEELRDQLLEALAHTEAWIDFPEEDISPETGTALADRVSGVLAQVRKLLATADQGRILREGARTVIYGHPNVGKSSLLNHLLGYDRAIVCETAGTTRDTIEETINFHGIPLRLVDTAGIRETADFVEHEGIERTHRQLQAADLILHLMDGTRPQPDELMPSPSQGVPVIDVLNKADLAEHPSWTDHSAVRVSCVTGQGMENLSRIIVDALQMGSADWGEHLIAVNVRHRRSLEQAEASLEAALPNLQPESWNPELAAVDLREALEALGEIPGKVGTEDLLGMIFSRFCIGK